MYELQGSSWSVFRALKFVTPGDILAATCVSWSCEGREDENEMDKREEDEKEKEKRRKKRTKRKREEENEKKREKDEKKA